MLHRARLQSDFTPTYAALGQLTEALLRIEGGETGAARALHEKLQDKSTALAGIHTHAVRLLSARIAQADGRADDARTLVAKAVEAEGFLAVMSAGLPELLEFAARIDADAGRLDDAMRWARESIRVFET